MAIYNVNKDTGDITETAGKYSSSNISANQVTYDNTDSGLTATDVQGAVDELAQSYPADKVMMSDGVTSVEEAIDELTADTIGTAVNVFSYTSSNKYTCPSDGYLCLTASGTNAWVVYAMGLEEIEVGIAESTGSHAAFYVRKGMQIWKLRQSSSGTLGAKFYPLQ